MTRYQDLKMVTEGLLDSAIREYRQVNLESSNSVAIYAENALDICLNENESKFIYDICKQYVELQEKNEITDSNTTYYLIQDKLKNFIVKYS